MSDHNSSVEGLLSEDEREILTDPTRQSVKKREELVERVADRLWDAFGDIQLLYTILTEDEFQSVFDNTTNPQRSVRAHAHHALIFLYYGLQLTDDDVTYRVSSAIEAAEAANDRDATVTLDIVTQPFLPPDQQVEALKNGDAERVSLEALDRLWYDDQVPPADAVDVFAALGETDLTVEDVEAMREETSMVERMPAPVITDVEVTSESPTEDET